MLPDHDYVVPQITKPLHLIQSDLVIEDHNTAKIGQVKMDWHVWKRRYDLFLGSKHEIGRVDGEFLAWEFNVMGPSGALLAPTSHLFLYFYLLAYLLFLFFKIS